MARANLPPVLGALPASDAASILHLIGDSRAEEVAHLASGFAGTYSALDWLGSDKTAAHQYTAHSFGFVGRPDAGEVVGDTLPIKEASTVVCDASLKNQRVKITLDRLRVWDYPGDGEHTVLFDFSARHQSSQGAAEDLRFTQKYRALEGTMAGISGYPIFVGLTVGAEGVNFSCYTVNVENREDRQILGFLDNAVFKKGLELLGTVNPVIPVVTSFATGITETFAKRHNNVPVQDFYLGLDFSGIPGRAQLREGMYVVVQVPDGMWDWSRWVYKPTAGQIVDAPTQTKLIPLNYVVFSVSRMNG